MMIFMMSIFEVYESKERAIYPKSDFIDNCLEILQKAEREDNDWIQTGEKAPSRQVIVDIFTRRTKLTNPLWKKALMIGLGYRNIQELMGDECN